MKTIKKLTMAAIVIMVFCLSSCQPTNIVQISVNKNLPNSFSSIQTTIADSIIPWKQYFTDPYLLALIDSAIANNQELNITLKELDIMQNEVRAKKGEYLPFIGLQGGYGLEKPARYTSKGANDANTEIYPGLETPEPLSDYAVGFTASWELDIWKKLRNAKKSALTKYLASVEGRRFMQTQLVAEIAISYYELLALDNELEIINQNIAIQKDALEIVKMQKQAARASELAVKRFEAQLLNTHGLRYSIEQEIVETENKINFLLGRFPSMVPRASEEFLSITPKPTGVINPAQLLLERPDLRRAELNLESAKLDVKVARARFYPSFGINAGVGFQAFDVKYFLRSPESLLYNIASDIAAPLVNRNQIKAWYKNANAKQFQAVLEYEQSILNAFIEVQNQISKINNIEKSYSLKLKEVDALTQSTSISSKLFSSARADYMEVLLTQRDALESKFDLIEIKKDQLKA